MTLREALDLLELNERTLEQSMLDVALQNRLEHTELRHVLRVFEAYRKVNAFLNPTLNSQGDARVTIIDESIPGEAPMEVSRVASPVPAPKPAVSGPAAATQSNISDFEDDYDVFDTGLFDPADARETVAPIASPRTTIVSSLPGVARAPVTLTLPNALMLMAFGALAFGAGVLVLGPLLGRAMSPRTIETATAPKPAVPTVVKPSVPPTAQTKPVVTPKPSVAQVAVQPPTTPVTVTTKPTTPKPVTPQPTVTPTKPAKPAITATAPKPAATPAPKPVVVTKPQVTEPKPVTATTTKPVSTVASSSAAKPVAPKTATARATVTQVRRSVQTAAARPRVSTARAVRRTSGAQTQSQRVNLTRRAPIRTSAPRVISSRRSLNQAQFNRWDRRGAVLRFRSWALVPDSVRALPASQFRALVFVASSPAAMPDLPK